MPQTKDARDHDMRNRLFELLLGAELVGVSALALSAVCRTGRQTSLFPLLVLLFRAQICDLEGEG